MISISNIAWDTYQDEEIAKVLNKNSISYIDIAPSKYFSKPSSTFKKEILEVKHYWNSKGIEAIGMQSLLFGTTGLNLFGSEKVQDSILDHLTHICRIGSILGARKLVFGSPKNRDRSHLNDIDSQKIAINFFNRLGAIAQDNDVVICLEPNPVCYNSNFMTTSPETAYIIQKINHPNIKMQLDIGAMYINNEEPHKITSSFASIIHHIHISEPQLAPLDKKNNFHREAAKAIRNFLPDTPMTIEMLTTNSQQTIPQIQDAIEMVKATYGDL